MPTSTAVASSIINAWDGGRPWALGTNILRRRHSSEATAWSVTGSYLDPDLANDPLWPPTALWNGNLYEYTQPLEAQWSGEDTLYVLFRLDPGTTFEQIASAAMVKFTNADTFAPTGAGAVIQVQIQIADDNTFATNLTTIAGTSIYATNAKVIFPRLMNGFTNWWEWSAIEFIRLRIHCIHGDFIEAPQVSELVVGQHRQFAHNPRMPHDPYPYKSSTEDHLAKSGALGRNINFERLARFPLRFKANPQNAYALDEEAAFRSLLAETRGACRPFLWVDRVRDSNYASRDTGYWVYCPTPEILNEYVTSTVATEVSFEIHELPPGQAKTEDFSVE